MSAMGGTSMAGGMTSMMWARAPGQTWPGAAVSFLVMWTVMMTAMMLPSILPTLWRYRAAAARGGAAHPGWLTTVVAIAYLFVWTVIGAAIYPAGAAVSVIAMAHAPLARAAPIVVGAIVLIASGLQFTGWKARRLGRRGDVLCGRPQAGGIATAWGHGMRLGIDCAQCCAGPMAIPLVVGTMDLRVMAAVTVAITAERLVPGIQPARYIGSAGIGTGLFLIARAVQPW